MTVLPPAGAVCTGTVISLAPTAAITAAADPDEDGHVDGNDLARWRTGFGTGTSRMQGDADNDGVDVLTWQRLTQARPWRRRLS